ncbi:gliding motility-associated C-terminal domain-containing protein [Pedobacter psychroterrae]|uniref:T9SS type B sorting domain-containing protein n=1 Tax=Pedobacter psychroterrae TaxID=2530453 RepID=A0A4R0NMT7_9SPHI|nr:gliding motility-associated C-terminal domain-containing protein [Pedobacter psychroterrae]TCD00425.1 T9SS type B sorting domain-containing protein [Pedobacter psychroterrae]
MKYKLLPCLLLLFTLCTYASLPASDATPRPVTICSGANIIIKGDELSILPDSYLWEVSQNGLWTPAPGVNNTKDYLAASIINPMQVNMLINVRRKNLVGVLTEIDSYYIMTVQPILPVVNNNIVLPVINSFCGPGNPAAIVGATPSSGTSEFFYIWQSSTDNKTFKNIDGATAKDFSPDKLTETTYFRRVAIPDGCALTSTSNTVKLTVVPPLANNTITAPLLTVFCVSGDPGPITGETPSGGTGTYIYKWQKSLDNVSFIDIPGAAGPVYDPPTLTTTAYFRRVIVSEPCNIPLISNVVRFEVMAELFVPEFEKSIITVCSGSKAVLSIKNPVSGISYLWYDSPAKTNLLSTGTSYLTDALSENKTFYVLSSNGICSSPLSGTIQVVVSPLPSSNVLANGGKTSICSGSTATFSVTSPNADFRYNWYTVSEGGTPVASGSNWTSPNVTVNTTYYLEVVNKEGCASATRQPAEITVLPILLAPVVTIESVTQHSITFKWNPVSGVTGYMVSIDNGQTYTAPSSGSNGLTHTVNNLRGSETVTFLVKATGILVCQESENSSATTGETIKEFDDIFVPNAFTPNNDGQNDIVYVRSQTLKTLRFYIYSQWGEQLYYSTNIANGWDGTFKGISQPTGVYIYTLKATMNDGREINKKGTITLIK